MVRYPIGYQDFESIRNDKCLYVDKTMFVERLVNSGKYYFLSRPRRFGKSLMLSTLKAFFEGKRELFDGLYLGESDKIHWETFPVIYIDLNGEKYTEAESLTGKLDRQLTAYEAQYGVLSSGYSLEGRFQQLITAISEKTGKRAVVLIDEYEKPILDTLHMPEISEKHRDTLSGFYSVIKSSDQYLHFCFLTGVTQFGHINIFSGLNNLQDISLHRDYSTICGVTQDELHDYFKEGIAEFAKTKNISEEEVCLLLKENYDGYHFSEDCPDIYNPFSLVNAFSARALREFWFKTGSPSFLVNYFRHTRVDISHLDGVSVDENTLYGASVSPDDSIAMLYQTGYLTIKDYDDRFGIYRLGYPNREVKRALLGTLMGLYTGETESAGVSELRKAMIAMEQGDISVFLEWLAVIFANFPYENVIDDEKHYQNVVYIVTEVIGLNTRLERHTSNGRIDLVIQTDRYVYIIEFKRDKSPAAALAQIEEKGYARPFLNDPRKLIKVGVEFSTKDRCIARWQIAE